MDIKNLEEGYELICAEFPDCHVKEENKDAEWAKAIVDAYHSDEFKQYMEENNDGLWWIPDELK